MTEKLFLDENGGGRVNGCGEAVTWEFMYHIS